MFVLSSPSGGGKTTVIRRLRARIPELIRSVSVTTRPKRRGERPGRDYLFMSPARFEQMRRAGQLLECADVHGAWYGTPSRPILQRLARGQDTILNIDVQGARTIRRVLGRRAVLVFLLPPSMDVLKRRLMHRRTESRSVIAKRLAAARRELACVSWYDYTVVNDRLDEAVRRLEAIIVAQRCRVERQLRRA